MIQEPDRWERLKQAIRADHTKEATWLITGAASNFESYKATIGYLRALDWVLNEMGEIDGTIKPPQQTPEEDE